VLIGRIAAEAVKNVFDQYASPKDLRAIVEQFESGAALELGDTLPVREVLDRIDKVPGLRKRAETLGRALQPDPSDPEARDAITAAAAEFLLEGLHVHNRLNKNAKAGGVAYRR
jgi:magnesium chelatase subunit I